MDEHLIEASIHRTCRGYLKRLSSRADAEMTDMNCESIEPELLIDDEEARYESARAAARAGKRILLCVEAWARDPRPRLREMAAYLLGQVHNPEAERSYDTLTYDGGLTLLLDLLVNDSQPDVRANAAIALGNFADPASIPTLETAASDPSGVVRFGVAAALGSFYESTWTANSRPFRPIVRKALLKLMDDENDDVRDWATFGIH